MNVDGLGGVQKRRGALSITAPCVSFTTEKPVD